MKMKSKVHPTVAPDNETLGFALQAYTVAMGKTGDTDFSGFLNNLPEALKPAAEQSFEAVRDFFLQQRGRSAHRIKYKRAHTKQRLEDIKWEE